MSTINKAFARMRAPAIGAVLLLVGAAFSGTVAADEFEPVSGCLDRGNFSLTDADNATATLSLADADERSGNVSLADLDERSENIGLNEIESASGIGITEVEEQSDVWLLECSG